MRKRMFFALASFIVAGVATIAIMALAKNLADSEDDDLFEKSDKWWGRC